jgi:hypothetical protein
MGHTAAGPNRAEEWCQAFTYAPCLDGQDEIAKRRIVEAPA